MKTSREQCERREDELAEQEYQMSYVDLPGSIKLNIHNAVLEEFGLRQKFEFTCLDCGKYFEDEVEGNMVEIFADIQSETHTKILESVCSPCKEARDRKAEEEEWKKNEPLVMGGHMLVLDA